MKRLPIYAATLILCGLPTLADAGPRPFKQGGFDNPAAQMGRKALRGGALAGTAALRQADAVSIDASLDRNPQDGRSGSIDTSLSTDRVTYDASTAYDSDTGLSRSVDATGTDYSVSKDMQSGLDENGNREGYHSISAAGADGALETQTERDAETGYARSVQANGAERSFTGDAQFARNADGQIEGARTVNASGDQGTLDAAADLNAETGFSRSVDIASDEGAISSQTDLAWSEENGPNASRSVSASGEQGAFDTETTLDAETGLARSLAASGDQGSVDVKTEFRIGEGVNREVTCTNPSGDQVACP